MGKRWLAGMLLLLAATTGAVAQSSRAAPQTPIGVEVADGQIVVGDAAVRTTASQTTLVWKMLTPGYRFASNGVDFGDAQDLFNCAAFNNGQSMRCTKTDHVPGRYRYRITVVDEQAAQGPATLQLPQPNVWIQNE